MTRFKILFCFFFFFLIYFQSSFSQTDTLQIYSPSDGEQNVSLSPDITLITTMPIDTFSFYKTSEWEYPTDTTMNLVHEPTVIIIEKSIYDSEPDSMYYAYSKGGEYEFVNDTCITVTPTRLEYATDYVVIVQDLNVIQSDPSATITLDEVSSSFTTVERVHHLSEISFFETGGFINCSDTLVFSFNRKLDSITTYLGAIIDIKKIISTTYVNPTKSYHNFSNVSHSCWFNDDSTKILCKATNNFHSDTTYITNVNIGYVTGDTLQNQSYLFNVRNGFFISIEARTTDTSESLPEYLSFDKIGMGERFVMAGDSLQLIAPEFAGNQTFDKWECTDDPDIHNSTNDTLIIIKSCDELKDLELCAVYKKTPVDTVNVLDTTGIDYIVFNCDGDSIGTSGTYYVQRNGQDCIFISAKGTGNSRFDEWYSDFSFINGSVGPTVSFSPIPSGDPRSGDIIAIPIEDDKRTITFFIYFHHTNARIGNDNIWDAVNESPTLSHVQWNFMEYKWEEEENFSKSLSAYIDQNQSCDCYYISKVEIDYQAIDGYNHYCDEDFSNYSVQWSGQISTTDQNKNRTVVVFVDRKMLKVEAELIVNYKAPNGR